MAELGDARLIARTIIDTTPGAGDGAFESYTGSAGRYQEERRPAGDGRGPGGRASTTMT